MMASLPTYRRRREEDGSRSKAASASRISAMTELSLSRRSVAEADEGALAEHKWQGGDPLYEPQGNLRDVPVKGTLPLPKGTSTNHPSLGARGCSRPPPRADAKRKRPDAPSFRHRRTSLRHAQMPRRLSPLPRSRLRQGARRMEPDGALLQLYPRAQYPRLRGLRGLHGKAIPVALTRPYGRFKLHPAPSGNVLDKYAGLASDQTLRSQPRRVINTTCPVSTGKSLPHLSPSNCRALARKIYRLV